MIPITKPYMDEAEAQAAYDVIMSGWVVQGPKVAAFEKDFSNYVGCKHAIAVSSCTTALHLSLIVAGIKRGDEVICPSMSFIATANAIVYTGATPVFAEVKPFSYNLDINDVEKRITERTKAIILVHQIGIPADIDAFNTLCQKYRIVLIEDAACALGTEYKGKKIGTHSELVCFSFHPRKVITTGDGGMICTNQKAFAERCRTLRQHSMSLSPSDRHNNVVSEKYNEIGYNYRMTDIQAAVGIEQLKKMDDILRLRRDIATQYNFEFKKINWLRIQEEDIHSNYQSYSLYLTPDAPLRRDEFITYLYSKGIIAKKGIMTAHSEYAYNNNTSKLPITEDLTNNSVLIPIYPGLTNSEAEYIIQSIVELK